MEQPVTVAVVEDHPVVTEGGVLDPVRSRGSPGWWQPDTGW